MPAIVNSWKENATYMDRGVRTVQRWENNGLPIRRLGTGKRAPVFAFAVEIDQWLRKHPSAASPEYKAPQSDTRKLLAESQLLVSSLRRNGVDFLFLDLDIATNITRLD
jgi:phage terminase Nu1 subunit (DNA packaging protein)